jgi:hypothetical protein
MTAVNCATSEEVRDLTVDETQTIAGGPTGPQWLNMVAAYSWAKPLNPMSVNPQPLPP